MVSVPMTFVKVGKNEFQVIYDELITRKYWDRPIGLKLYIDKKGCNRRAFKRDRGCPFRKL